MKSSSPTMPPMTQKHCGKTTKSTRSSVANYYCVKRTKEEQALLTYGVLACLKGLKEQGCDGPVEEAINKIEKHINQVAHE